MLLFFFNDTATTEIYTLSLHDALPIFRAVQPVQEVGRAVADHGVGQGVPDAGGGVRPRQHQLLDARADRKSTRLNSSHANISYAVFCLKKKKSRASAWYPKVGAVHFHA